MAFAEVLRFYLFPVPLDTSTKMPPAGHRRPHKRREAGGEYWDMDGKKNPPRAILGRAVSLVVFVHVALYSLRGLPGKLGGPLDLVDLPLPVLGK